jgi:hypothetical protein
MTTPTERTRNLVQAGAFLKELGAEESLPAQLRNEANRLLRHYPTVAELHMLAMNCSMLTTKLDQDWLSGYRFGAHA